MSHSLFIHDFCVDLLVFMYSITTLFPRFRLFSYSLSILLTITRKQLFGCLTVHGLN